MMTGHYIAFFISLCYSSLPEDYYCKVEFDLTSDGKTRVCYHPSVDVPYEHKKPIPGLDPVHNNEETHAQVQKKTDEKEKVNVVCKNHDKTI